MGRETLNASEWYALVDEWESSSLSQNKFCEAKGISYTTFGYWRAKYLKEQSSPALKAARLIEIKVDAAPREEKFLETILIHLGHGVQLELNKSFSLEAISALCQALRGKP